MSAPRRAPSAGGPDAIVVEQDEREAPAGWDARAVQVPGGHVMQSAAWASYRHSQGFEPHFLTFADGSVTLRHCARRCFPASRRWCGAGPPTAMRRPWWGVARAAGLAAWAADLGARDLYLDPERPADPAYEIAMDEAGFGVVEGLEPSVHVMRLDVSPGTDEESLFRGLSKSTRQRIRSAQRQGTTVQRTRSVRASRTSC